MQLNELLNSLPVTPEALIWVLRITGIVAIILAIALFARGVSLNNALSAARAQKLLHEHYRNAEDATPIVLEHIEETRPAPDQARKTLIVFTLPVQAHELLSKLDVSVLNDNGWSTSIAQDNTK